MRVLAKALVTGLGENDQALAWLQKAEEPNVPLHHTNVDQRSNSLRSDKSYQQLLRRIGFPPWRAAKNNLPFPVRCQTLIA